MEKPEKLIRAWRSGLVYLILDGFDELAPRIATSSRKRAQDSRNSAIALVRRLTDETPEEGSIVLAGRNNYFDTDAELHSAVGINKSWKVFEIHDLDDEDLARFIKDHGWAGGIPSWVPKKPLLISYVKQNGLVETSGAEAEASISDPASGWNFLIDKICEREVNQVYVALEAVELRQIYSRLATFARCRVDRRGPLAFADCRRAFVEVTGVEPEERSVTAILRLPRLSGSLIGVEASELERGSRFFVDPDLADCLSAGDVEAAILLPYNYQPTTHLGVVHALGELGRSVVYCRLGENADVALSASLRHFSEQNSAGARNVCADLVGVVFSNFASITSEIFLSNLYLDSLRIEEGTNFSRFIFDTCAFHTVEADVISADDMPIFQNCQIAHVRAPAAMSEYFSQRVVPHNQIDSLDFQDVSYEALRNEGAPEDYLDLVSIIDKVFIQSKKGRQLTAVFRGRWETRRAHIDYVLGVMEKEGWVTLSRRGGVDIVEPNMSKAAEAKAIIAKKDYKHPLLTSK